MVKKKKENAKRLRDKLKAEDRSKMQANFNANSWQSNRMPDANQIPIMQI